MIKILNSVGKKLLLMSKRGMDYPFSFLRHHLRYSSVPAARAAGGRTGIFPFLRRRGARSAG